MDDSGRQATKQLLPGPIPSRPQPPAASPTKFDTSLGDDDATPYSGVDDETVVRPGRRLEGTRYQLLQWIGGGGMGVVFEAQHMDLERKVALKILRAECCRRPELLKLFRDEARTVSRIGSQYIVEVFDFAELPDGRLMFTMELLDGPTLREVIDEHGPMDPARAIGILRQVCKGLAAAHDMGVIHRDIKPENIVLAERNGRADAVKLLDFGISAMLSDARSAAASRAGTPYYIAPEALSGMPHDARADIYSVGCMAYEMLVSTPPFRGTESEVLQQQLDVMPVPIRELEGGPQVPAELEAVVLRCMAKDPEDRYANAEELEAALCEAQIAAKLQTGWDDLEVPNGIDPARRERLLRAMPDPATRALVRQRGLVAAVAGLAAALAIVLAWALMRTPDPTPEEVDTIERLTVEARAAAAKAFFVYPPPDEPEQPTAYRKVLELEALEGSAANAGEERANELRNEFAATLNRLGDRYWDAEGGKPFAIDYYAAALVLAPDDEHARDRAYLTPGELALLRQKATDQSFSRAELEAAEPLVVLAEDDVSEQTRRLERMQARADATRSASTDARVERLVRDRKATAKPEPTPVYVRDAEGEAPAEVAAAPADVVVDEVAIADAPKQGGTTTPAVDDGVPKGGRDPQRAAALVDAGERSLRAGRLDEARRSFEKALEADQRSAAALMGLSRLHFDAGRYTNAADLAARAVRIAPRQSEYRVRLGDAYYKSYRYADARDQYARAAALGHPQAEGRLGKVAEKLK